MHEQVQQLMDKNGETGYPQDDEPTYGDDFSDEAASGGDDYKDELEVSSPNRPENCADGRTFHQQSSSDAAGDHQNNNRVFPCLTKVRPTHLLFTN